jgi:hypothetical protein
MIQLLYISVTGKSHIKKPDGKIAAEMRRGGIHETNSGIHVGRSHNKYRDCKGIKYNPSFG